MTADSYGTIYQLKSGESLKPGQSISCRQDSSAGLYLSTQGLSVSGPDLTRNERLSVTVPYGSSVVELRLTEKGRLELVVKGDGEPYVYWETPDHKVHFNENLITHRFYACVMKSGNLLIMDDNVGVGRWSHKHEIQEGDKIRLMTEEGANAPRYYKVKMGRYTYYCVLGHLDHYPELQLHLCIHEEFMGNFFFEKLMEDGCFIVGREKSFDNIVLQRAYGFNTPVGTEQLILTRKNVGELKAKGVVTYTIKIPSEITGSDSILTETHEGGFDNEHFTYIKACYGIGAYHPKHMPDTMCHTINQVFGKAKGRCHYTTCKKACSQKEAVFETF